MKRKLQITFAVLGGIGLLLLLVGGCDMVLATTLSVTEKALIIGGSMTLIGFLGLCITNYDQ